MGSSSVEVLQEVLADTQSAVQPTVPYLDTLRWVFIVLALGGIGLAIWARLDDCRKWWWLLNKDSNWPKTGPDQIPFRMWICPVMALSRHCRSVPQSFLRSIQRRCEARTSSA